MWAVELDEHSDLDAEVALALSTALDGAVGRYPIWGSSPQSRRVILEAERHPRWFGSARTRGALAVLTVAFAVGVAGLLVATRGIGGPFAAGGGPVRIWAVAALSDTELVAVGESGDSSGGTVVARSTDAGHTWTITYPQGPALTTISAVGQRLVAATDCSAQYAGVGPSNGLAIPTSCLYESTDGGLSWHDLHQGPIVDPSFVDGAHGFAHSPLDTVTGSPSRLYPTTDGGHTWGLAIPPCGVDTPWIAQAIAVGPTIADVLCVAGSNSRTSGAWELVKYVQGTQPVVLSRSGSGGVGADVEVFRFSMLPSGDGMIFGDQTYRTTDGGTTWTLTSWTGARMQGGCFTAAGVGYFVFRDRGRFTGIATTTDGGVTWSELIRWPFFGP